MTRRAILAFTVGFFVLFTAGAIWGAKVDPKQNPLLPLPRGEQYPDYLITTASNVFAPAGDPISPYDEILQTTYYDWQHSCMRRMNANDYQEIGGDPLSHGLHYVGMLTKAEEPTNRGVYYGYWDKVRGWTTPPPLPMTEISKTACRGGYVEIALIRPLIQSNDTTTHSRAVIIHHYAENVVAVCDMNVMLSIEPDTAGANAMAEAQYWYDIPDYFSDYMGHTWEPGMWPAGDVDSLNRIHVLMLEGATAAGISPIGYVRCEEWAPDTLRCQAPGDDTTSRFIEKEKNYTPEKYRVATLDWSGTEGYRAVTSKISNKLALVWAKGWIEPDSIGYQTWQDIYYTESTNGGDDWFEAGGWLPTIHNITSYDDDDTVRAYADVAAIYDLNDSLHIFFHTHGANPQEQSIDTRNVALWHWSKATERTCDGDFLPANEVASASWEAQPGAWNRLISKFQCGVGILDTTVVESDTFYNRNHLYIGWVQFNPETESEAGYSQGDIYLAFSASLGSTWTDPLNITNSTVPACTSGECASDHWFSMAERVDTALYMQWTYDRDAGGSVQDEGTQVETEILSYHKLISDLVWVEQARIDWSPRRFVNPYINVGNGQDSTVYINLENIGTKQLNIFSVFSSADWISIGSYNPILEAGGCPTKVPVTISGSGKSEEFLVDSINIVSDDEAGNNNVWVNVHAVVSDIYKGAEWDSLKNPTLMLWNSNTGNTGKEGTQGAGFYIPADDVAPLFDASPLLATTNSNGDTVVGRWIFDHHYTQPATEIVVDSSKQLKTIYSEAEFWPTTPHIPPPYHWEWLWWRIKVRDLSFYSEEGRPDIHPPADRNDEQYIVLRTIQLRHDPPPEWWCHYDPTPPGSVNDAYLGMGLDIDCPSDSGKDNYPGYDPINRYAYLQGLGPGKDNFLMAVAHRDTCHEFRPDSFWCWPDIDRIDVTAEQPNNMHILRNDAFVYPQGGYRDDSLYKYMGIAGYSVYGDSTLTDYNILTTGRVIPAHAPNDTLIELRYAILVSDRYKAKLDTLIRIIKCGDTNRDSFVDIVDVVYLISYMFKGGPEPWKYMCDFNGDGGVSVTDIVYLIGYIFQGADPPMCSYFR